MTFAFMYHPYIESTDSLIIVGKSHSHEAADPGESGLLEVSDRESLTRGAVA